MILTESGAKAYMTGQEIVGSVAPCYSVAGSESSQTSEHFVAAESSSIRRSEERKEASSGLTFALSLVLKRLTLAYYSCLS